MTNTKSSFLSKIKNVNFRMLIVGSWRSLIYLILIIATLPICWLVDYQKMANFVHHFGSLSVLALTVGIGIGGVLYVHPIRWAVATFVVFLMFALDWQHKLF